MLFLITSVKTALSAEILSATCCEGFQGFRSRFSAAYLISKVREEDSYYSGIINILVALINLQWFLDVSLLQH